MTHGVIDSFGAKIQLFLSIYNALVTLAMRLRKIIVIICTIFNFKSSLGKFRIWRETKKKKRTYIALWVIIVFY